MTLTDVAGVLIVAYVSGWCMGFMILQIKRFFDLI